MKATAILILLGYLFPINYVHGGGRAVELECPRRRNLLQKIGTLGGMEFGRNWQDGIEKTPCMNLQYESSIYIEKHVYFLAVPKETDADGLLEGTAPCPAILFESSEGTKNYHFLPRETPVDNGSSEVPLLALGQFPLWKIKEAFDESASVGKIGDGYDLVLLNCGDFAARMVTQLQVTFDQKMVRFLALELLETYDDIANLVRANRHAGTLFDEESSALSIISDVALIERLVESKVKHLYKDPASEEHKQARRLTINEDSLQGNRRLDTNCGMWYSSECLADTDIRYDPDSSNALTDQAAVWGKLHGFYEASATAYDKDGKVQTPTHFDWKGTESTQTIFPGTMLPYPSSSFQVFINLTLQGSRYYEQAYFIHPPAPTSFCNETAPAGKENVAPPGECGRTGISYGYERYGTSSFEKDGRATMLSFGRSVVGTVKRESYASIPVRNAGHFSSYKEGDSIESYSTSCLDPDCNQFTTMLSSYDASKEDNVTLVRSIRIHATRVDSQQTFVSRINELYTKYEIPYIHRVDSPMTGNTCLTGNCPEESDWCELDPECAVSPYQEPPAQIKMGAVLAFGFGIVAILGGLLFLVHLSVMKKREKRFREHFARRIAETVKLENSGRRLTPEYLAAEFKRIDADSGGTICKEELWDFVSSGKAGEMRKSDFDALFAAIDLDNNGKVDFMEFISFFGKCKKEQVLSFENRSDVVEMKSKVFASSARNLTSCDC